MKRLIIIILIIPLCGLAQSPKKLVSSGDYDEAIRLLIPSLEKNSKGDKNIALLKEAFTKANQEDLNNIMALKRTGMPDIWDEVFRNYRNLEHRQDRIRKLPANVLHGIEFELTDYDRDMESSKAKAAAFHYALGMKFLSEKGRPGSKRAYDEFWQITRLYESYKDVDRLMLHALVRDCGTVPVKVINRTGNELPPFLPREVAGIPLNSLEKAYLDYTLNPIENWDYEYTINIYIDRILISPDQTDKTKSTSSKEIMVGEPMDSSSLMTVTCDIFEVTLRKAAEIISLVAFVEYQTGKLVYQIPLRSKTEFNKISYYVQGDLRACPEEVMAIVKKEELPAPDEGSMVKDAAMKLAGMIKEHIWDKEFVFQ